MLLYTFVNLDKLIQKYTESQHIVFNDYTKHRILLSLLAISDKFLEDLYYENTYYSQIGGISLQDLNTIEIRMLELLDYRLYVSVSILESVMKLLKK